MFSSCKKNIFLVVSFVILFGIICYSVLADTVSFRIVAVNPSKVRTQFARVKVYLPQEVKPKDVVSLGGLNLEFDSQKSLYYVYKNGVALRPSQTKIFVVEINDIWIIPKEEIDAVKERINKLLLAFKDTSHYDDAKKLSSRADDIIAEITKSQSDETISRSQHIGAYRTNIKSLARLKDEISDMEKLLETKSGPLTPDIFNKSKFKTLSPAKSATWIVIFSIIIFIGLLSVVFFFTWYRSSRSTRNIIADARKVSFGEEESEEPAKPSEK